MHTLDLKKEAAGCVTMASRDCTCRKAPSARLQQSWDADADHICIQANHPSGLRTQIDERIFDLLAPASA